MDPEELVINKRSLQKLKDDGKFFEDFICNFLELIEHSHKGLLNCLGNFEYKNTRAKGKGHGSFRDHILEGTDLVYYIVICMDFNKNQESVLYKEINKHGERGEFIKCLDVSREYRGFIYIKVRHEGNFRYVIPQLPVSLLYNQFGENDGYDRLRFAYPKNKDVLPYLIVYAREDEVKSIIDCYRNYFKEKEEKEKEEKEKEEKIIMQSITTNTYQTVGGNNYAPISSAVKGNQAADNSDIEVDDTPPITKEESNTLFSKARKIFAWLKRVFVLFSHTP